MDHTYTSLTNCVEGGIGSTKKIKENGEVNGGVCKDFERQGAFGMTLKVDDQISLLDPSLMKKNTATFSPVLEELEVNNAPELSPDNSFSAGAAKDAEGQNGDPGSGNGDAVHAGDPKRQRKRNYGSCDAVIQSCGYNQHTDSHSNHAAAVNCNVGCELKKDKSLLSSTEIYDASNVNENICALCYSPKIIYGTGPMLHYADGKEVPREVKLLFLWLFPSTVNA